MRKVPPRARDHRPATGAAAASSATPWHTMPSPRGLGPVSPTGGGEDGGEGPGVVEAGGAAGADGGAVVALDDVGECVELEAEAVLAGHGDGLVVGLPVGAALEAEAGARDPVGVVVIVGVDDAGGPGDDGAAVDGGGEAATDLGDAASGVFE